MHVVRREGTIFTGVCLSTLGGIPHLHPIILPLVPCPFWGYPCDWSQVHTWGLPHLHTIILPLVPCPFWGYPSDCPQVLSGPRSFLGPLDGILLDRDGYPQLGMGYPPDQDRTADRVLVPRRQYASCVFLKLQLKVGE